MFRNCRLMQTVYLSVFLSKSYSAAVLLRCRSEIHLYPFLQFFKKNFTSKKKLFFHTFEGENLRSLLLLWNWKILSVDDHQVERRSAYTYYLHRVRGEPSAEQVLSTRRYARTYIILHVRPSSAARLPRNASFERFFLSQFDLSLSLSLSLSLFCGSKAFSTLQFSAVTRDPKK